MKNRLLFIAATCFILSTAFSNLSAKDDKSNKGQINVSTQPVRSIGIFTLAVINEQLSNVELINQEMLDNIQKIKLEIYESTQNPPEVFVKAKQAVSLTPAISNLAYIPLLFSDFSDIQEAYKIILSPEPQLSANKRILKLIKSSPIVNYTEIVSLTEEDKKIAEDFVAAVKYIYSEYYYSNFDPNNEKSKKYISDLKKEWTQGFNKALAELEKHNKIENIKVILIPAITENLRHEEESLNNNNIITILPSIPSETKICAWSIYYHICHIFASELVQNSGKAETYLKSDDYTLLINNCTAQLMFEGLKASDSKLQDEFIESQYGDLKQFADNKDLLKRSLIIAGNHVTQMDIDDMQSSIKANSYKTAKLIFENAYLVPDSLYTRFNRSIEGKIDIIVHTKCALALYRVLLAIHQGANIKTVEELIDEAFMQEGYQLANRDYSSSNDVSEIVSLAGFKNLLLGLCNNEIVISENNSLQNIAANYINAIADPAKYLEVIEDYNNLPLSFYKKVLNSIEPWLPANLEGEKINIWILFDMKPNLQAFNNNIYIDVFSCLTPKDQLNKDLYFRALCFSFYRLFYKKQNTLKKQVAYMNLPESSKLKMLTYFFDKCIEVGIATKIGFNVPGVISTKFIKDKPPFWIAKTANEWKYFEKHSLEIFANSREIIKNILDGKYKNFEEFHEAYVKQWSYFKGSTKDDDVFDIGDRFYLGCEIIGAIYNAYGKEGLLKATKDPLKIIPLFNKALKKTKPKGYKNYLYPKSITDKLNYDYLLTEKNNGTIAEYSNQSNEEEKRGTSYQTHYDNHKHADSQNKTELNMGSI